VIRSTTIASSSASTICSSSERWRVDAGERWVRWTPGFGPAGAAALDDLV
jgi:hypothetical protein